MEEDKNKISSVLKKVLNTGISAAFMTEDAVKSIINDLPLPKEVAQGLLNNAKATKDEFVSSVKNELKTWLERVDLGKEIEKVIENYDVEIKVNLKRKKGTKRVAKKLTKPKK